MGDDTILRSGIEWLKEFSHERRAARLKASPTIVYRAVEGEGNTYEFKPKLKHNFKSDTELTEILLSRKKGLTLRIIKRLKELNPEFRSLRLEARENFGSARNILGHGKEIYNGFVKRRLKKQQHRCYLCFKEFGPGLQGPTYDHVVPKALGGQDGGNMLLAHLHCNGIKSDRPPFACELLYLEFIRVDLMGHNASW
jgi:hypothetical protein